MKLYITFILYAFATICYSNDLIEAHANLLYIENKKTMHVRVVSGHVPEKGEKVTIQRVFQLGRLSGTYLLAEGRVAGGTEKDLKIEIDAYKTVSQADGNEQGEPLCENGDELLIQWEGVEHEMESHTFDDQLVEAKTLFLHDEFNKAIDVLSELIEKDAHCSDCYYVRGRSFMKMDDLTRAINDFTKVIELHPKSAKGIERAYQFRAAAYFDMEKYESALADFDALLALELSVKEVVFLLKNKIQVYLSEELSDRYDFDEARKNACDCVTKVIALEGETEENYQLKKMHCD